MKDSKNKPTAEPKEIKDDDQSLDEALDLEKLDQIAGGVSKLSAPGQDGVSTKL